MKIICIGRNYAAHAAEMKAEVPDQPVVFMKPPTALLVNNKPFYYPEFTKDVHYECELVVKIAKNGRYVQPEFARDYIGAIGLGIDLTARDLQSRFKQKGQPWELAKGFDHSAPISDFVALSELPDLNAIEFRLDKNGTTVQQGNSQNMLFSITDIIVFVSQFFKLQMGDLLFTGTPEGVGPIAIGDLLEGYLYTTKGAQKMLETKVK